MAASVQSETGAQFLARLQTRVNLKLLDKSVFQIVEPGEVLEIYGDSNSGKTEMLYTFIANCILPHSWKSLIINGHNCSVLFIDTDYKFSVFRLMAIMEKRLFIAKEKNPSIIIADEELTDFLKNCMLLINILRCKNMDELITTIYGIEDNIISARDNIALLIIDSISAFYWVDRMTHGDQFKALYQYYGLLVNALSKVVNNNKLVLVVTKQPLKGLCKNVNTSMSFQLFGEYDIMGKAWQNFVTKKIKITNILVDSQGSTRIQLEWIDEQKLMKTDGFINSSGVIIT